ncbi:hypothetical protein LIER_43973 [Lithospermum erythrorhizon]|uniref:Uncharacterized protein n=1 Tax=Lithospermum erythrorhizon TaxID=34254 RepID=A0AAV3RDF0_LITER
MYQTVSTRHKLTNYHLICSNTRKDISFKTEPLYMFFLHAYALLIIYSSSFRSFTQEATMADDNDQDKSTGKNDTNENLHFSENQFEIDADDITICNSILSEGNKYTVYEGL